MAPDRPFSRAEEDLRVLRFSKVDGATPKWRKRSGPIEAAVFPDGAAAWWRRYEGKVAVEERRFDAYGNPLTTTALAAGVPLSVEVEGLGAVDVATWTVRDLGGVTIRLPPAAPSAGEGEARWEGEGFEITATRLSQAGADPMSDAFRDGLAESCGCLLVDRQTTWLGGRRGAHYRARLPDPAGDREAELWAVGDEAGALLLASVADDPTALARGRAVAALVSWSAP